MKIPARALSISLALLLLFASNTPDSTSTLVPLPSPSINLDTARDVVELAVLSGFSGPIYGLDWSPDGRTLAVAEGAFVQFWDTDTATLLQALEGHSIYVTRVAYSPDGSRLASGGQDQTVRIWDVRTGDTLAVLQEQGVWGFVFGLRWSPNGTQLAAAYGSGNLLVWDAQTGELLLRSHEYARFLALDWSPDGSLLATGT